MAKVIHSIEEHTSHPKDKKLVERLCAFSNATDALCVIGGTLEKIEPFFNTIALQVPLLWLHNQKDLPNFSCYRGVYTYYFEDSEDLKNVDDFIKKTFTGKMRNLCIFDFRGSSAQEQYIRLTYLD